MATVFVFDLDDTLYKEIDYLKSAYRDIAIKLQEFGVVDAYPQMLAWYEAKLNVFDKINAYYHLNIPVPDFLNWYRYHLPQISLSDGADELLKSILASGSKVGLITDGRTQTQRNKIEALGLSKYIDPDEIIISEEFGSEKPDARNFQYFMDKHPLSDFVYVADNPRKDFVTPNKLGWMTIGLLNDGRNIHTKNHDVEKEYLPKAWVKSLKEIITTLDNAE
jgi:putative hydrolase of the HAD superfamily